MRNYMIVAAGMAMSLLAGCMPAEYSRQADSAAYAAVSAGQKAALGETQAFDVRYRPLAPVEENGVRGVRIARKFIPLGDGEPKKVTLDECLEIAFHNNRGFQDRKESLYSSALALASARRDWNWSMAGGTLAGDYEYTRVSGTDIETDIETGTGGAALTFTQRFIHGAQLALGAALDLTTDFLGSDSTPITSLVNANLTQPLLQGAWRGLAYEDQHRLERDFVFSVFDYERFTQTFAVSIVKDYYDVLQQRDELENEKANIERLEQTLALTKLLVEGGDRSRTEQDEAEQNLLNAKVRLERNRAGYQNTLDSFKMTLGLPIEAQIEVGYPELLEELVKVGPKDVALKEAEAIGVALSVRPDVLTRHAAVRDARRNVEIAADAFWPQLDLELGISATGSEDHSRPFRIRTQDHTRTVKLRFNYQLDQTPNRDAYRNAEIEYDRAVRNLAEFMDGVRLEVRQSYRSLLQSRRSYELQVRNVEIARRRRKLEALKQKEGEASTDDVLRAEEALRSAQNGRTNALVSYTTTRLEFLASMGMLTVDEKGLLHEREKPFGFSRVRRRYPAEGDKQARQ